MIPRALWTALLVVAPAQAVAEPCGGTEPRSAPVRDGDDERAVEEAYGRAVATLIEDLHDFAGWCASYKLYLERDGAYEAILRLDPDDVDAHRGLKHKRRGDGTWEVPDDLRPSRNYDKKRLDECRRKRTEVVVRFRDAVLALLAAHGQAVPGELRERAFAVVLALAPDDPRIRALRREVQLDGAWVLEATARGKARRKEITSAVRAGIAAAGKARQIDLPDGEAQPALRWKAAVATAGVRCLTTGELSEAAVLAQRCEAAAHVFRDLFRCDTTLDDGFTVYLLDESERDRFVDGLPDLDDRERAFLKQLTGAGIPETADVARWDAEDFLRLDGALRHTFGRLLDRRFDVFVDDGWIWEGFGLYLTRHLCGTRLTWYVQTTAAEDPELERLRSRLGYEDLSWMDETWKLLQDGKTTPLEELFLRGVDQMNVPDMLLSYVLAAYLLEGRPDEAPEVLARIGAGGGAVQAFEELLGLGPEELEAEVVRWLEERR